MNVEGDFRYVDMGAYDECSDFLDYLADYGQDWEKAFTNWIVESRQWKDDRKRSNNYWDQWNVVKVLKSSLLPCVCISNQIPVLFFRKDDHMELDGFTYKTNLHLSYLFSIFLVRYFIEDYNPFLGTLILKFSNFIYKSNKLFFFPFLFGTASTSF